uniref:SH2 domain-containing protein n=1 Tax=Elaeophora elaphi TaxID=1147741 RepID=A0A0R3RRY0_9BILA
MVSLLTLCVSTHCCRNARKKENPYGEIATTPAADISVSTVISRNRANRSQLHHSSRLSCPSMSLHERSCNRLSVALSHSSAATKRALPELPEQSTRFENKNPSAVYSTIDHTTPSVGRNGSFLYGEGPTNPTYESIDMDPLYSKLGNGGPSVKRYDYPIFVSENQPPIATDDVLYQSASQIYAGVSEDPYSSITSRTVGETNYDVGYSHVREGTNTDPSRYLANVQAESRTLDHLYSRIRRGPSMYRATNLLTYRPLPSNEFDVEYISSGSDKTSREPSYRYITVRETVDAIRQRLNEFNTLSNISHSGLTDGCGPIREHYYSSIGGSDYETLQISTISSNQPSYNNQDIPSTSCASHDTQPGTISSSAVNICENIPPKPPTSPIPLRITAVKDDLQRKQLPLSGIKMDEAINDDESRSNISEKIRRLRTNFFDQELKLLENLKGPSSTDIRFGQLLGTINQYQDEISKGINFSEINRNLDPEHYDNQISLSNFGDTNSHLPKFATDRSFVHAAQDVTQGALLFAANRQNFVGEDHYKIITENSKSRSFRDVNVFGIKQSVEEDAVLQQSMVYSLGAAGKENNDEEQCFILKERDRIGKQAENNSSSACFAEQTSPNEASSNTEKDMEAQFYSDQRNMVELLCGGSGTGTKGDRSAQTASFSFSHESIDQNDDESNDSGVRLVNTDPSWSLISSSNFFFFANYDNCLGIRVRCNHFFMFRLFRKSRRKFWFVHQNFRVFGSEHKNLHSLVIM